MSDADLQSIAGSASAPAAHDLSSIPDDELRRIAAAPAAKPTAASAAEPSTTADVLESGASGVAEGVYGLAGLPGDVGRAAEYGGNWLAGAAGHALGLTDKTASEFAQRNMAALDKARGYKTLAPSSEDVAGAAAKIGIPDHTPETTAGQYAKTIGSSLPGAVAMPFDGPAALAGNAIKYGVIPGALSEAAGQATEGTVVEPYARTVAGLAGGLGADAVAGSTKMAAAAGKAWWEPATAEGYKDIAARELRSTLNDPELAKAQLQEGADAAAQNNTAIGENVANSKPTTGQYLGDENLLQTERDLAVQRPDLYRANEHGTGADQQNAARAAALQGVQPVGAPEAVGDLARRDLADIQAKGDTAVTTATDAAEQAAPDAETAVRAQADAAAVAHADSVGSARQEAETQAGGIGTGASQAELGAAARGVAQDARDNATELESGLWQAIDPERKLAAVATPASSAAKSIVEDINPLAEPRSAKETAVFNAAENLPTVAPLQDLTTLRGRVADAMRETKGVDPPAHRRLTLLQSAIDDTIQNAVDHQAAHEAKAVQAGVLPADQTMAARVQKWADDFKLAKPAFRGDKPAAPPKVPLKPNVDEAAIKRSADARAATIKRVQTFDKGPVGVMLRSAGTAGNYRAMDSAVPSIVFRAGAKGEQTAKAYLDAAGPAGQARLASIIAESFRKEVAPNGVADPKKFASWSNRYAEALRAAPDELQSRFANAARATETLQELEAQKGILVDPLQGAAESLSRKVMKDGKFDPKEFERWSAKHADTIKQMPQDVQDKLSTAAKAAEAVGEAAAERKASIDGYQKSVAGKFLGLEHPADVTRAVAGILDSKNSVQGMSALAKRVSADPDAKEGLRKAIADELLRRATSTQEAGASGVKALNASTFQKLIRDKSATIKAAGFSDQEVGLMHRVADDMERSQRTMSATKLPNSPGTAQDVAKFMERARKAKEASSQGLSLLTKVLGGAYLGFEHGGIHGLLIGAGAGATEGLSEGLLHARRNAGLGKAADLLSDAIRKPEIALELLKRVPPVAGRGSEHTLRNALIRNSMFGANTIGGIIKHG
jgi:hypothetical protein